MVRISDRIIAGPLNAGWLWTVLLLLSISTGAHAQTSADPQQSDVAVLATILDQHLRAPNDFQDAEALMQNPFAFREPRVKHDSIQWEVVDKRHPDQQAGILIWREKSAKPAKRHLAGGILDIQRFTNSQATADLLVSGAQRILDANSVLPDNLKNAERHNPSALQIQKASRIGWGLLGLLGVMALSLWRKKRRPVVEWQMKANHFLQAGVQSTIFVYWAMYDDNVIWYAPYLVLQILGAYLVDAILALTFEGKWRIGAGPLPVVLSTNLFAWYLMPWKAALVITVALASKYLLRYKDGSVVFNPSGVALALMGITYILAPQAWSFNGVVHQLELAPNMTEWILLIALVPQRRFPIVLVSLGCVGGLLWAQQWFLRPPSLVFYTTVLAVTLLVTEPRTMSKTGIGRVLQGFLFGALMAVSAEMFQRLQLGDDFAKVLPLPFVNLMVRPIDAMVRKLPQQVGLVLNPKYNKMHMVAFLAVMVWALVGEKAQKFQSQDQWINDTPIVIHQEKKAATCQDNPAFCVPFGFGFEVLAWAKVSDRAAR
jgi:hypothetical protein